MLQHILLSLALTVSCTLAGCQGDEPSETPIISGEAPADDSGEDGDAPGALEAEDLDESTRFAAAAWTVNETMAMAQSGVGFSYRWAGGCWKAGGPRGACYGSCPRCTHAGAWGADCSGYVAKVWQVPGRSATSTCRHPYSTANFVRDTSMWRTVPRSQARRGDAFVRHSNGSGHIFLFDRGSPWGSIVAYEASGCSKGIIHGTRSADSRYHVIRRAGF